MLPTVCLMEQDERQASYQCMALSGNMFRFDCLTWLPGGITCNSFKEAVGLLEIRRSR